ncbi:hypothetical protein DMH17_05490 [Raoultella planticola]|nr:hypothetical protein [Raoultella planticola]
MIPCRVSRSDGNWAPKAMATLSNAMDVSQPNNWPRVEELFRRKVWRLNELGYAAVDDETTKQAMRELKAIITPQSRTRLSPACCATSCSRANTVCSSVPRTRRSSREASRRSSSRRCRCERAGRSR